MEGVTKLPRNVVSLIRKISNFRARGHSDSTVDCYRQAYWQEITKLTDEVAEWLAAGNSVDWVRERLHRMHGPARRSEALRKIASALKEMP